MNMGIIEARDDATPMQVNDFRARTFQPADLIRSTNRYDQAIPNCDRLCFGLVFVFCPQLAVNGDQIRFYLRKQG
jgi:hypothetical protein